MKPNRAVSVVIECEYRNEDPAPGEPEYFVNCTVLSAAEFLVWLDDPDKREVLREIVRSGDFPWGPPGDAGDNGAGYEH